MDTSVVTVRKQLSSVDLQKKVDFALSVIAKRIKMLPSDKPLPITFSGGKDSVLLYNLMREVAPNRDIWLIYVDCDFEPDLTRQVAFNHAGLPRTRLILIQERLFYTGYTEALYTWNPEKPLREKSPIRTPCTFPPNVGHVDAPHYLSKLFESKVCPVNIRSYSYAEGINRRAALHRFLSAPDKIINSGGLVYPFAMFCRNSEILTVLKERYGIVLPIYAAQKMYGVRDEFLRTQIIVPVVFPNRSSLLEMLDAKLWTKIQHYYPEITYVIEFASLYRNSGGLPKLFDNWYEALTVYLECYAPEILPIVQKFPADKRNRLSSTLMSRLHKYPMESWMQIAKKLLRSAISK